MWSLLPSVLLVAVFLHHRWRMSTAQQSAWKGGGFAMFSDIHRNAVAAAIWVPDAEGHLQPLQVEATPALVLAATVPTVRNLEACGRELLESRWQRCGDAARPLGERSFGADLRAWKVTLRHLRIDFDAADGVYSATERSTLTMTADSSGVWP